MKNKFLFISTWAPPSIGGPQSLYNLLCQFSDDEYSVLTSFNRITPLSRETGKWLKGQYFFYDKQNYNKGDNIKTLKRSSINGNAKISVLLNKFSILKKIIIPLFVLRLIVSITNYGTKILKKEKINVLVGISDDGPALISSFFLSKLCKKPLVLWFFDVYKGNIKTPGKKILSIIFEPLLIKHAKKIIVTNEGTRDFYITRYKLIDDIKTKIVVIQNSVFPQTFKNNEIKSKKNSTKEILFTGHIYWPQIGALENLIKVLGDIKTPGIKLKIYCPDPPKDFLAKHKTNPKLLFTSASQNEIFNIQQNADLLFLPLSWNTKSPDIIETATPGKLTDYLNSGRPILVHAPDFSYVIKYAKKYKFAEIADVNKLSCLKDSLLKVLNHKEIANEYAINGLATFNKFHNAENNYKRLKKILNSL